MALELPREITRKPAVAETRGVRAGRHITFHVDVLDTYEDTRFPLKGVQPDGSLEWHSTKSVKSAGKITVVDTGQDIDWLNDRMRVKAEITDDSGKTETVPLGIYLPAAPSTEWNGEMRQWDVELTDKLSILDSDIITDSDGEANTYTVTKGSKVIDKIKAIIADSGERSPAIEYDDSKKTKGDMSWDASTTRLQIINDLLDAVNCFSLFCDGGGQYRVRKYRSPQDRSVVAEMLAPFVESSDALLSPEWTHDEDIYDIPNRLAAIESSDGDDEGDTAVAENRDPDSPYSYDNRMRWITKVEDGVDIGEDEDLKDWAKRHLESATSVKSTMEIEHVLIPDVTINEAVNFSAGNLDSIRAVVDTTTIPLDPEKLVQTKLAQATKAREKEEEHEDETEDPGEGDEEGDGDSPEDLVEEQSG